MEQIDRRGFWRVKFDVIFEIFYDFLLKRKLAFFGPEQRSFALSCVFQFRDLPSYFWKWIFSWRRLTIKSTDCLLGCKKSRRALSAVRSLQRMRFCFFPVLCVLVFAPDFFTANTLGRGRHASAALKQATAKTFKRLSALIRAKVLVKGPNYKTRFTKHEKLRQSVAFLLGVSMGFVKTSLAFVKHHTTNNTARLPEPKKSGRNKITKEEYQRTFKMGKNSSSS